MKKILLLGASGSIGTQTIDIIRNHKDQLELVGASVGANTAFLSSLLDEFKLEYVYSIERLKEFETKYPKVKFYYGDDGLEKIVLEQSYNLLVNGLVGFVGFYPTIKAIENKKDIALANKETLVAGGDIVLEKIKENNVKLYPIDSEHSAIWQCLEGHKKDDIKRLIITGSGGSFRDKNRNELENVTVKDALNHPVWTMGSKITIDSATMMNKGFEVIEAHYLFDIPYEKIDVILHKESIVHSMVEYNDGSIIAQLGCPDMHLPIKYALLYPNHLSDSKSNYLDLDTLTSLNFKKMDYDRYPLVKLAKDKGIIGGNYGAVLIGANDEAVKLFLEEKILFMDIERFINKAINEMKFIAKPSVEDIIESNAWAKEFVRSMVK